MRVQSPSLAPFYQVPREVTAACSALNGVVLVRVQPGQPVSARDGNQAYLAVSETADCRCNSDRADQFSVRGENTIMRVFETRVPGGSPGGCANLEATLPQWFSPNSRGYRSRTCEPWECKSPLRHQRTSGVSANSTANGLKPRPFASATLAWFTNFHAACGSPRTAQRLGSNPMNLGSASLPTPTTFRGTNRTSAPGLFAKQIDPVNRG